jgi:hypothetical protein
MALAVLFRAAKAFALPPLSEEAVAVLCALAVADARLPSMAALAVSRALLASLTVGTAAISARGLRLAVAGGHGRDLGVPIARSSRRTPPESLGRGLR